jgi:DNA processing protein
MDFPINELAAAEFPALLREIPQPPKTLNYRGVLPSEHTTLLSIVGSRKYTTYGKQVVEELVGGLSGYPVGIVSGLALGIDSLSHEAALRNNLYTLAIPGGGLSDERLYPATHKPLAYRILEAGGGLLSEFAPDFRATNWSFPQRNRLVAGISRATLLIEAGEKSGTLITARMTTDYNRELLVVPGSIFSKNSLGVHQFLKLGATPVTTGQDILDCLHIEKKLAESIQPKLTLSPVEELVLIQLHEPLHRDELIRKINLPTHEASQLLMMMELQGHIKSDQHIYRASH